MREPDARSSNQSSDGALWDAVRHLNIEVVVVDLQDFTMKAVSAGLLKRLGRREEEAIGYPAMTLIAASDREKAEAALQALRAGAIDYYQAHRQLTGAKGEAPGTVWVKVIQFDDGQFAFVQLSLEPDKIMNNLATIVRDPAFTAVGVVDKDWVVTRISADVEFILGRTPDQMVGRQLLDPPRRDEVRRLLDPDVPSDFAKTASIHLPMETATGEWRRMCLVFAVVAGATGRLFVLVEEQPPVDESEERAARLEQHLLRIAGEVQASGVLQHLGAVPDPTRFPQLSRLTSRQWEVLSRLLRGERVPTIAKQMFISQSTVRNHLSAIYDLFGVHSQAEVLSLLAGG